MGNKTFNGLAKGASLFLVGGILGSVLTYNTFEFDSNVPTNNTMTTSAEGTTEANAVVEEPKVYYSPSEALNTVVSIDVVTQAQTTGIFGELFGDIQATAQGSGVIYSEDQNGVYIITNNHVVEGAQDIKVRLHDDDEGAQAKLVGRDPSTDLAVIYVTKAELKSKGMDDYLVSQIGDSDEVEVFDTVYAIGNAAGEGKTGTTGSVSALDKEVGTTDGEEIQAIQIDAAINPGNSGGALVNENGELIGINFAKVVGTELEGMGYSIPINDAVVVANEIIETGSIEAPVVIGVESKPFMGVMTVDISKEVASQYNFNIADDIVVINQVVPGGPAFEAGMQKGDIIKKVEGKNIKDTEDLQAAISDYQVGDIIKVEVARGNKDVTLNVTLGDTALFQK